MGLAKVMEEVKSQLKKCGNYFLKVTSVNPLLVDI